MLIDIYKVSYVSNLRLSKSMKKDGPYEWDFDIVVDGVFVTYTVNKRKLYEEFCREWKINRGMS